MRPVPVRGRVTGVWGHWYQPGYRMGDKHHLHLGRAHLVQGHKHDALHCPGLVGPGGRPSRAMPGWQTRPSSVRRRHHDHCFTFGETGLQLNLHITQTIIRHTSYTRLPHYFEEVIFPNRKTMASPTAQSFPISQGLGCWERILRQQRKIQGLMAETGCWRKGSFPTAILLGRNAVGDALARPNGVDEGPD
jgi:hypothetical protein